MMTIEGGTSGDVFAAWVERFLLPELPPNALVVMDNLAAPKDKRVKELLDSAGAKAVYLPPHPAPLAHAQHDRAGLGEAQSLDPNRTADRSRLSQRVNATSPATQPGARELAVERRAGPGCQGPELCASPGCSQRSATAREAGGQR